ncbi:MAG: response regulator [Nitrosopumilaceae archaeon]
MKSILVVDDNQDIAEVLKVTLEIAGYKCMSAYSGQDCLQLLSNNNFDLVVLDIAMPDVTGVDILKKVKSDPKLSKNKIVFITASSPTDDIVTNLVKQGALEVVKKPITEDNLLKIVSKYA